MQPRRVERGAPQQVEQLVGKPGSLVRRSCPGVEQQEGAEGGSLQAALRCCEAAGPLLAWRRSVLPLPRWLLLLLDLQLLVQGVQLGAQEGHQRLLQRTNAGWQSEGGRVPHVGHWYERSTPSRWQQFATQHTTRAPVASQPTTHQQN